MPYQRLKLSRKSIALYCVFLACWQAMALAQSESPEPGNEGFESPEPGGPVPPAVECSDGLTFDKALLVAEPYTGATFDYLMTAIELFPNLTSSLTASPYTLLAPTDEAFKSRLGDQLTLEAMENPDQYLKDNIYMLLLYHLIPQGIQGETVTELSTITYNTTVDGETIEVSTDVIVSVSRQDVNATSVEATTLFGELVQFDFDFENDTITIIGSTNSASAVEFKEATICSGGALYILDDVLIPEGLLDEFSGSGPPSSTCTALDSALRVASVGSGATYTAFLKILLANPDVMAQTQQTPSTIFVPTDQAVDSTSFSVPVSDTLTQGPVEPVTADAILKYHIVPEAMPPFTNGMLSLTTLQGSDLQVEFKDSNITVIGASNRAHATLMDSSPVCGGSYVYSINQVLLPPATTQQVAGR